MSSDKRIAELKINTIIIAIANLGSKAITFILAPLYSYYLTVEEYGQMDLITTMISLIVPLVCLDIYEATFRFAGNYIDNKKKILSSSLAISIPIVLVSVISAVATILITNLGQGILIAFCLLSIMGDAVNSILAQYLRGINNIKAFAMSGVLNSIVLLVVNFITLIMLNLHLYGWVLSFLIAKFVVTIFLCVKANVNNDFSFSSIDRKLVHELLRFSIPLVPTAVMWWIMNASDRYMISFFLGVGANGLYSAASKIPNILSVFENIFYQAWQTSAINAADSHNRDAFYSHVFNNYLQFLCIGTMGLLIVSKPIMGMFNEAYFSAWTCLPFLIISIVFHAISGTLGSIYTVFKNTKGALYSTVIGATVNITLNLIAIPKLGINGAALTTCIGYLVTFMYRWFDTRKKIKIELDLTDNIILLLCVVVFVWLYYQTGLVYLCFKVILLVCAIFYKRKMLISLFRR